MELAGQASVEIICDENPIRCLEELKNYPVESGGAARLVYICPHCSGEMTYASECNSLVSQCPNCQNLIILGRTVAPEELPSQNAFQPFFQEVKTRGNSFFSDSSVSVKFAIFLVWIGFIMLVVLIHRNDPATTPAYSSSSSSKWTESAFANGSTWNSEAADAKWNSAKGFAVQSGYGVSAQTLYRDPNTSDNNSDAQALNAPIEFSGQSIETPKDTEIYK